MNRTHSDTSYMVWDYPAPPYDPDTEARDCACGEHFGADGAFLVGGEWCCAQCFREYLSDCYTLPDIAHALQIETRTQEEATYGSV